MTKMTKFPILAATLTGIVLGSALLSSFAVPVPVGQPAAAGRTLYVNGASGDDSVSYGQNSAERPWKSIGRAAWGSPDRERRNGSEAARAGDTVLVASGTYEGPGTNTRNEIVYFTENSGEPGRPITFRADGTVRLALSGGRGPVIGAYRRNYITWDGFTLHEASAPSAPDTGSVTVWECDGCVLQNLDINGNGNDNNRQDNHTGIRIESSRNVLVRNNRIHNVYTGSNVNNGAGIMVYASGGVTFEHNEIFNCGSGIFIKGGPPTHVDFFTVRYNLIHDIGENRGAPMGGGIILHAGAPNRPDAPARVYQNVVKNVAEAGIKIWMLDGRDPLNNPMNARIFNNTIDTAYYGLFVQGEILSGAGHVFHNNILVNIQDGGIVLEGSSAALEKSRFDSEHNLFFRTGDLVAEGRKDSLSGWRRRYGQDGADPESRRGDPKFVDAEGGNYRLQPGSPARGLGVDGLDLDGDGSTANRIQAGAYITGEETIGRRPPTP